MAEFIVAVNGRYEEKIVNDLKYSELVRCKDCLHFTGCIDHRGKCAKDISCWVFRDEDWFCADGERKEGR